VATARRDASVAIGAAVLVPLLNPKLATVFAASGVRISAWSGGDPSQKLLCQCGRCRALTVVAAATYIARAVRQGT
jgi:hypothetical protein